MDKQYQFKNLKLIVKDRELLPITDEEINEEIRTLVDWKANLSRLHEADPQLTLTLTLDAKALVQKLRRFSRDEGSFWFMFHEHMDSLLFEDLKKRDISLDKLHYGIAKVSDVEYTYTHMPAADYEALRSNSEKNWYKIVAVLPPYRMGLHRNTFYVPGARLHEFLERKTYAEDDRYNRIIHIEPVSEEQCHAEIADVRERVEQYKRQKYRSQ